MTFFVAFFILLGISFAFPLTLILLPDRKKDWLSQASVTFGLSLGMLTLFMFYLGVFAKEWFNLFTIASFEVIVMLASFFVAVYLGKIRLRIPRPKFQLRPIHFVTPFILVSIILIVLFSLYFPFTEWDTIVIYGLVSKNIFEYQGLSGWDIPHLAGFKASYPLLVPLAYVYTYLPFGVINEYAAKLIPALFAAGTIAATYLLGERTFGKRVGLVAAFLVSVTPLFTRWAPSGYTDIPMTFYFTLASLFFFLTLSEKEKNYPVLAGLFAGFAAWTRIGAVTIFFSFLALFALFFLLKRLRPRKFVQPGVSTVLIVFSTAFLIVAPWYISRLTLFQTTQAAFAIWIAFGKVNVLNLLPFISHWREFGFWLASVYSIGILGALLVLLVSFMRREDRFEKIIYLFFILLPFHLLWWYRFSYDTRFLVTVLPFSAVLAAVFFEYLLASLSKRWWVKVGIGTFVFLAFLVGIKPVYSRDIFVDLDASDREKRLKTFGDAWPVVEFFRKLETKEKVGIVTMDGRLIYFLDPDKFEIAAGAPHLLDQFTGYDYYETAPWGPPVYARSGVSDNEVVRNLANSDYFQEVFRSGNFTVYEILYQGKKPTPLVY